MTELEEEFINVLGMRASDCVRLGMFRPNAREIHRCAYDNCWKTTKCRGSKYGEAGVHEHKFVFISCQAASGTIVRGAAVSGEQSESDKRFISTADHRVPNAGGSRSRKCACAGAKLQAQSGYQTVSKKSVHLSREVKIVLPDVCQDNSTTRVVLCVTLASGRVAASIGGGFGVGRAKPESMWMIEKLRQDLMGGQHVNGCSWRLLCKHFCLG